MAIAHVAATFNNPLQDNPATLPKTADVPLNGTATAGNTIFAAIGVDKSAGSFTDDADFVLLAKEVFAGISYWIGFRTATATAADTLNAAWGTAREWSGVIAEFNLKDPVLAQGPFHSPGQGTVVQNHTAAAGLTASVAGIAVGWASVDTSTGADPEPWDETLDFPTVTTGWTRLLSQRLEPGSPVGVAIFYKQVAVGDSIELTMNQNAADDSTLSVAVLSGTEIVPAPALVDRFSHLTGFVKTNTSNTSSVRLKITPNADGTGTAVFTAAVTPNAEGIAFHDTRGLSLTAGTKYYYRVEMTGSDGSVTLDTDAIVGAIRPLKTGVANFTVAFSSCCDAVDSDAMAAIAGVDPDAFLHGGDLFYHDGSGVNKTNFKNRFHDKLRVANHKKVWAAVPSAMIASDHDLMNNNASAFTDPTAAALYNEVLREETTPASILVAPDGHYFSFVIGRVRVVMTDGRSYTSDRNATDDTTKFKLGSAQTDWLINLCNTAKEKMFLMMTDVPFIQEVTAGSDEWGGFSNNRKKITDAFAAASKHLLVIAGDMHAVAHSAGQASSGGVKSFQAAALNRTASIKGGPWDAVFPASGTAVVQQYGLITVTDDNSNIVFAFSGRDSANAQQVAATYTYAVAADVTSVTRTVDVAWQAKGSVTAARDARWNARSLATAAPVTRWNTRAAIPTVARDARWSVRITAATVTHSAGWAIRALATAVRDARWNTRSLATAIPVLRWNSSVSFILEKAIRWIDRVAVSTDKQTAWSVLLALRADCVTNWSQAAPVVLVTRELGWNSKSIVRLDVSSHWSVRTGLLTDRSMAWALRTLATTSRAVNWNEVGKVVVSSQLNWNNLASLVRLANSSWNVTTSVSPATRDLVWASRIAIRKESSLRWRYRAAVSLSRPVGWSSRTRVLVSRVADWRVVGQLLVPVGTEWNTHSLVAADEQIAWSSSQAILTARELRWNQYQAINLLRSAGWRTVASVRLDPILRWSAEVSPGVVIRTISSNWNTYSALAVSRSTAWSVTTVVPLVTRQLVWAARSQVNSVRLASWDSRALLSITHDLAWSDFQIVALDRTLSWRSLLNVRSDRPLAWNVLRVAWEAWIAVTENVVGLSAQTVPVPMAAAVTNPILMAAAATSEDPAKVFQAITEDIH